MNPRVDIRERIIKNISKNTLSGCWEWTLCLNPNGYAQIRYLGKNFYVHRVSYELFKAKIQEGLTIDHLCKNRKCLNPDHLEAVSQEENLRRGNSPSTKNRLKTHCPKGHKYLKRNIYWEKKKNGRKGRRCKICVSKRMALRYIRVKKNLKKHGEEEVIPRPENT